MLVPWIAKSGLHMADRDYNQCFAEAYSEAGKTQDQDRIMEECCRPYSEFPRNQGNSHPDMVSANDFEVVTASPEKTITGDIIVRASLR